MTSLTKLRKLADDPEACITGTPMIPLHRDTVRKIVGVIEAAKAMRKFGSPRGAWAFDAALAAFEKEQGR